MSGVRRAWPLRRRLLVAVLGLCAAGLATFAVASVLLLERSQTTRADRQLTDMASGLRDGRRPPPPATDEDSELPTEFSVHVYGASGELRWRAPESMPDAPVVPAALVRGAPSGPVTLVDSSGDVEWRAMSLRGPGDDRVVIAISMATQQDTVDQLLLIELAVGALILVLVAGVGRGVVRLGLRPLTRMERTATAIAERNVDLRVADTDSHTETGQLGRALNTMLERLGQALRDREGSEQRLRHFVADASHELRTPLTSIRGFAELYRHGHTSRDPAVERIVRRIEDEAERMGVMVEDLLMLTRLDRERALDLSDVDLRTLVGDVVHDAHARHPGRAIAVELPEEQVRVLGDEHRLHQVVANLVTNAVTHSPAGTSVRVRVGHVAAAGEPPPTATTVGRLPSPGAAAAVVEVHDDGPGIDAEHLPFLFDRFYRADPARSHGGTGLGQAEAHDGRVEASSTAGEGTTFRVVLPHAGPATH
jgi:two-component system OmpR family sensor kinase